ncbi:ATP-NAD kinase-like domain-containing protein [Tanacetum coccineum]
MGKDEGLYQLFSSFNNLKDCSEAIRVVRPNSFVKKTLDKASRNPTSHLDSWNLVFSMPAGKDLDTPYSLKRSEEVVLDQELKVDGLLPDKVSCCQGVFYNYFIIGMDAQVAYGFYHLRNNKPYLTQGPISNKNGFVEARADDGVLEVFGFKHGWHASFVMVEHISAKHIAQVLD